MSSIKCSFCSRIINPSEDMSTAPIIGADNKTCICHTCIIEANKKLNHFHNSLKLEKSVVDMDITPKTIKEKLDGWIIEQELAKKRMSIAVYDHYKRINSDDDADDKLQKSNIILAGSTGSGKTAIIKAIARELNLPLHIDDVNTISSVGYQGRNVEDVLAGLLQKANGDIDLAQKGIILLDEGDKIKRQPNSGGLDVKGEGVQQGLLKITEGGTFTVKYNNVPYIFDSTNVLFILAGAFEGIEKIIEKRKNGKIKTKSGFTGKVQKKDASDYNELITEIKHEDLNTFGMMPELLGRFPVLTPLQELSEEALVKILTEPKDAIIKQMTKSFDMDNVELEFNKEALKTIAKEAKKRKIGARALRSIVEETLLEPKYDCPGSNIKKVTIRKDLSFEYDI